MNLTPQWAEYLNKQGHEARHWSSIGSADAPDLELMKAARNTGSYILTQDLDFGILLALTSSKGPSVVQIRSAENLPSAIGDVLLKALDQYSQALSQGAILTIDLERQKIRLLPIR
jgi:predicted nuclease of predicted toxin-antitoxin system